MSSTSRIELQPVVDADDAEDLATMLGEVNGRVESAGRGYADELKIVIVPSLTDVLFDGQHRGTDETWRIGTQGSRWRLLGGKTDVNDEDAAEAIDAALQRLVGAEVGEVTADVPDLGLVLRLVDGRRLVVSGAGEDVESLGDLEPPFWELFTPDGHVISAGPGPYWARLPANIPERDFAAPLRALRRERSDFERRTTSYTHVLLRAWIALAFAVLAVASSVTAIIVTHKFVWRANVLLLSAALIVALLPELAYLAGREQSRRQRRFSVEPDERLARARRS